MTLRHYFPASVAAFALFIAALHFLHLPVPIVPVAIIFLVGETFLGFMVEGGRAGKVCSGLLKALKSK